MSEKESWMRRLGAGLRAVARVVLALGLALPSMVGSAQSTAGGEDWPMYMGGPRHAGRTSATTDTSGPQFLQWAYAFGERVEVEAQPVLAGGVLYQGVMNGEMHAIDALTGKPRWVAQPGGPIAHTAAVADGRVVFGSLDGSVYALSAADGSLMWKFSTGGPVVCAPVLDGGRVFIGSTDGILYALDAASGAAAWTLVTGGPVTGAPALADGRVYFGSEDMHARAVDARTGKLVWESPVWGQGMRNTYPVVADDGKVVIFQTVKPGASSYVPAEGYPDAPASADPVETWNTFYQAWPKNRTLYYFDAQSGKDLWSPAARRYVPLPIPYWGLMGPVLGPDGAAYLPAPAGSRANAYELDHDNRLFRVDLQTGKTEQVAGGPDLPEYQTRMDEIGRAIFSGTDYLYTSSEDLSVYHTDRSEAAVLFGDGTPASYFNIGSHMNPLSPLPSRHLWRYGGVIAMGGVPGASVPLVANNMIYYSSYSWLYAVGRQDRGLYPATSFPARDARSHELTYPRAEAITSAQARAEMQRRAADILARGPEDPPLAVRWDQPGGPMLGYEFTFEVYGLDYELVRTLVEAAPYLPAEQQSAVQEYLKAYVRKTLLDPQDYAYLRACLFYGETRIRLGEEECKTPGLAAQWSNDNPNLKGQRLYALALYARLTGDWEGVRQIWPGVVLPIFQEFLRSYDTQLGFLKFEEWRTGRLNLGAQIAGVTAVRDMAGPLGDTATQAAAGALLERLLSGRVALANLVPQLYDGGARKPATLRLNPDGTIVYEDVMGAGSPYNSDLIPYDAAERNRATDPSQVNWWDGETIRVDAGLGFMYLPALSEYYPLTPELAARLRARLSEKTAYYVKSYEVNQPWWWMTDLAHHTTGSGEHLYESPTLAWSMFQVKARVQRLPFAELAYQVPEPVVFNARYDLYRLQNLVALMENCAAQGCE